MGHIRLGAIPKSRPWRDVVAAVVAGGPPAAAGTGTGPAHPSEGRASDRPAQATVAAVAARTLEAADAGLTRAAEDEGLRLTVLLLSRLALASRAPDWQARLARLGIAVSEESTLFDLTTAFHAAIDERLLATGAATDVSEMAQRAAGEALYRLAEDRAETLFGNSGEALRLAIRPLSTKAGFGSLGQAFFGRFLAHYLNFYLSRVTAAEIGQGMVPSIGAVSSFNTALLAHCEQSAAIVRDFAGEWYSKTEYERGIDAGNVGGFVAVALQKLRAELRTQRTDA